jgi:hypothetical protein
MGIVAIIWLEKLKDKKPGFESLSRWKRFLTLGLVLLKVLLNLSTFNYGAWI